ncbi:MAG: LysR family transcriptional regulator substrate-binding protein, partial [Primorskyibacter sp.]
GLAGHLRIGVIPTALTWASRLCTAFAAQHPNVHFSILSRSSAEILRLMEGIEIDAGISYLDNEPLGRVSTARLYRERYAMVCAQNHPLADRPQIPWAEVAAQDLCLLTPDMQNRRIINRAFMEAGTSPTPRLEANSTVVLMAQVAEAGRVTVLPADLARFLGAGLPLCSIPIVRADTAETAGSQVEDGPMVGLITPHQEPHTPVLQALLRVARTVALPDD